MLFQGRYTDSYIHGTILERIPVSVGMNTLWKQVCTEYSAALHGFFLFRVGGLLQPSLDTKTHESSVLNYGFHAIPIENYLFLSNLTVQFQSQRLLHCLGVI